MIGARRTPFAVRNYTWSYIPACHGQISDCPVFQVESGGHAMNPGFSSTKGIHISTGRFSQVTYDAVSNTAVIGTGLIWDTVYERLHEHGVVVPGGRFSGVSRYNPWRQSGLNPITQQIGVGGFLLGGGWFLEVHSLHPLTDCNKATPT